jgi:hypothetical protein
MASQSRFAKKECDCDARRERLAPRRPARANRHKVTWPPSRLMLIAIDTPIPMSDKDRSSGDESPQQAAVVDDIDAEKRMHVAPK